MKKYKAAVEQLSLDQTTITDQCIQISELEAASSSLKETIAELTAKLETLEVDNASQQVQKRFQLKVREVETRLELETTTRTRLEVRKLAKVKIMQMALHQILLYLCSTGSSG